MNNLKSTPGLEKFSLYLYLRADLHRVHELTHGTSVPVTRLNILQGALSFRFLPVLLCRLSFWFFCHHLSPVAKLISLINFVLFGIEIAVRCPIGPGLFLPHTQGTVLGALRIGANATIFQGVTLGATELDFSYDEQLRPVIGDSVIIGSGAKVLGGLIVNDYVRVGANSVVLESIPPHSVAVGAPARVVRKLDDEPL